MSARTALLLGATGLVGRQCLDLLLRDEDYDQVTTFGRRALAVAHEKLEQRTIDFERLEDYAHSVRAHDLFCCLGTTIKKAGSKDSFYRVDFTYPHEFARIASQNGAEQLLLVSALGADARSSIFYSRIKGELEKAVAQLPFRGVQIFRPSLLLGDREEFRLGERVAEKALGPLSFLMVGPLGKYRPVHARTVASAMLKVAKEHPPGVNLFESDRIRALGEKD